MDLCEEENDKSLLDEIEREFTELKKDIEKLTIETLLTGDYDKNNAFDVEKYIIRNQKPILKRTTEVYKL